MATLDRTAAPPVRPQARRPACRRCRRGRARLTGWAARRRRGDARLRGAARDRVRPLARLNDSKQVDPAERELLFQAVLAAAAQISVRVDSGLAHRPRRPPPLEPLGAAHRARTISTTAEACLVDGFRLGPLAPPHRAVVDGDTKSAAIAAASIVAKVTRDRLMRRLDAVYPRYGFSSHVGYITPTHTAAVRAHGPCCQHRLSFNAKAYAGPQTPRERGRAPRRAPLPPARVSHPRANVHVGGTSSI